MSWGQRDGSAEAPATKPDSLSSFNPQDLLEGRRALTPGVL